MARFRWILVGLLFVAFAKVWSKKSGKFELSFVTWPNETQVVVNETVKFLWKYYVKGTDVDIRWGTSKFISPKVATFKELFFTARNYNKYRKPVLSKNIPARYRDRIRIIGQATLQIVNVTLEDEGDYLCEISDSGTAWKTLSRAATLRVLVPPHIESHPLETILLSEGEQLKLGCKASGRPLPDVSWYKDGVELTQDTGSSEYIKGKVSRGDDGTYMCIARNNASQDQYIVKVTVRYKPVGTKIKTDAKSDTLSKGGDLKIVCEADSKPQPTYNFYHESDDGVKKRIGGNQASASGELYIRNVNASDRGNYSCIPQNTVGKGLEAKVRVSILFAPKIIRLFPEKVNLTKNDALKISCAAVGFPKPKIKWTKGKNSAVFLGEGDVYEKRKVDENDAGIYVCTASNKNLPDARKSVIINVFYKPIIERQNSPIDVPARKGDQVKLKCVARGNPTPSFEWKTDYRDRLGFKSTYAINSIKESEFGRYTCAVSNAIGTTIHTVNVFEVEKPMVTELQVTRITARSAHVTWKQSRNTKFPITHQVLSYGLEDSKTMKKIRIPGEQHKHSYKIKDLLPYSYYVVRVEAWNKHIASDQKEKRFQTDTARPGEPGPPQMQIVSFISVQVNWTPPKKTNGELTGYMLQYSIYNDSSTSKDFKTSGVKTSAVLKDLKNAKTYKFRVKAATKSGYGNFSEYVLFTISTSEPSIPRDPKASQPSLNVYLLEWKGPLKMLGKVVKILVSLEWKMRHTGAYGNEDREIIVDNRARSRLRRDTSFDWKVELKQLSPVRKLQLKDLFPNTVYSISVKEGMKVKNGIYWSAKTQSVGIETPAGVPSKPMDVTVDMQSETSFSLTWKRPVYSGGKLKTYTIFYRTGAGRWKVKKLSTDLKNKTFGMTVDGVIANAKYEVKVQANGHKPGLFSNTVEFMQGSKILNVNIDAYSESSFTVTWTKPTNPTIKITKYTIYYRQVNGKWMSKEVTSGLNNNTLSVKVNGLTAGALYEVKLQARSSRHVYLSEKLEIRSATTQARKSEGNDYVPMFGGIIAGVLIFAFVIIVVAMFVRYNYRKRQRSQRRSTAQPHPTPGVLITRENGLTHMSSPSEHLSSDSPGSEKYLRPERKGNSVQGVYHYDFVVCGFNRMDSR